MSSEIPDTERDIELRRMLVATASAAPARPRRRWSIAGPITAFAIAGALTGAVSAAALTAPSSPATMDDPVTAINMSSFVYDDTELFGAPVMWDGQGDSTIELGARPDGAAELAIALRCLDVGSYDLRVDAERALRVVCDHASSTQAGTATYVPVEDVPAHTLTVSAEDGAGYLVWASWATRAVAPEPSPEQAVVMADGEVTETEYRAQFDRYVQCMAAAGYPVDVVAGLSPVIRYTNSSAAVSSGTEGRCYAEEFAQVDATWQGMHAVE